METLDGELEGLGEMDDASLGTLSSFVFSLERELEGNIYLKEAFDFGRTAMKIANELEEKINLRKTIHALINSSLLVATGIYRIHLLKNCKSIDVSDEGSIGQETLAELGYCQNLLEYLDSMVDDFSLIKKMKEQAVLLKKGVE